MAENIYDSGNRLTETVNLILELTTIEKDDFEIKYNPIDLGKEFTAVINSFKTSVQNKGLYLRTNIVPFDLKINVDAKTIRSILMRLINNAIKFTNEGGVLIDVSVSENFVEIKVIDTGIGISKEHHQIIFEEFRQVSEGISRSFNGTGLGLYITKKLVDKCGGSISVESEIGKGSTFTVKLPLNNKST